MDPADGGKLIYFDFGACSFEKLIACYPLTYYHEVCNEDTTTPGTVSPFNEVQSTARSHIWGDPFHS